MKSFRNQLILLEFRHLVNSSEYSLEVMERMAKIQEEALNNSDDKLLDALMEIENSAAVGTCRDLTADELATLAKYQAEVNQLLFQSSIEDIMEKPPENSLSTKQKNQPHRLNNIALTGRIKKFIAMGTNPLLSRPNKRVKYYSCKQHIKVSMPETSTQSLGAIYGSIYVRTEHYTREPTGRASLKLPYRRNAPSLATQGFYSEIREENLEQQEEYHRRKPIQPHHRH